MNLIFEYGIRRGILPQMCSFPCSFFTEGISGSRIVTVVHPVPDSENYQIKDWLLNLAKTEELPPCSVRDISKEDVCKLKGVILPGFSPIEVKSSSMEKLSYRTNDVMSVEAHRKLFDSHMYPVEHESHREDWLWSSFLKPYQTSVHYNNNEFCFYSRHNQQMYISIKHFRMFQTWNTWKMHMLNLPGVLAVAPERAVCAINATS